MTQHPYFNITADAASAGVQAATAVAQTISNIIDQGKRRKFEAAFSLLSLQQQQDLNEKMLNASTESQRLQILTDGLLQFAIANQQQSSKKKMVLYIVAGGLAVVLLGVALVYSMRKKNQS